MDRNFVYLADGYEWNGYKRIKEGPQIIQQTLQTSRTAAPWSLLVLCTNDGGDGGYKGQFEQGITKNTFAPKTYQQNRRNSAEQDPKEDML